LRAALTVRAMESWREPSRPVLRIAISLRPLVDSVKKHQSRANALAVEQTLARRGKQASCFYK
jgi:hypothetical protein